ncbi:phospholipase carboxylesterase [Crucibulum laeve]|uniref:Acyl-protein thioesterase 1 n=1 Tax=Crucibulum laeve TaxID=68775 RepID=A0A5C3MI83_9AGAR|nr:phospholipase carboxylesterase [Crucibulum laeve]
MVEKLQPLLVVPASQDVLDVVIFIHGSGQSNISWNKVVVEVLAPMLPHIQWILPQAPRRPITIDQGQSLPSWFDIRHLPPFDDEYDDAAITESISMIEELVLAQVHNGIDSRRIFLVGFSQGAALSLMVALTSLHELGGVVSLSGWIPPLFRNNVHGVPTCPVLWCHGTEDADIPLSYAEDAIAFLSALGVPQTTLKFRTYTNLRHAINDPELEDVVHWLKAVTLGEQRNETKTPFL